jgi:hypothetical protein
MINTEENTKHRRNLVFKKTSQKISISELKKYQQMKNMAKMSSTSSVE